MSQSPDHEARITRLETRVEEIAEEAAAARHLAAMADRDLADVHVKLDANRKAINALGEQTRAQFDQVGRRFERLETKVDAGFAAINAKLAEHDQGFAAINAKLAEHDQGFAAINAKLAEHDQGFAAMRHGFDQTAAGFARITTLIEGLKARGAEG
jgi:chromosome segregation ATPase